VIKVVKYDKKEGGFNRVFVLSLDSGARVVARVPYRIRWATKTDYQLRSCDDGLQYVNDVMRRSISCLPLLSTILHKNTNSEGP
jgi:hypothetical protein